jgi:hypothetical protein
MTDPTHHPPSRAGLAQRFGPRYRWLVLLTVMIGTMASIMPRPSSTSRCPT